MHTTRSRVAHGAAIVLLAVGLATGAATPSWADTDDVTWGVRTGDSDHGVERQNYTYEAEAGETVEDTIAVTNHGATPLMLAIYAADGFTNGSGQLNVLTPDQESSEIGAWTTIETDTVTLDPGESAEVPFQLIVPENASPGDYAGAIVTSLETSQTSGVSVDRRLGIRIYLQVEGELAPALAIEDFAVHYDAALWPFVVNPATVDITVRNAGNARLAASEMASLSGLLWNASSEPTEVPELLPGETWSTTLEVTGVIPSVHLTANGELVPIRPDDDTLEAVTVAVGVWAIPWLLISLIVLVGLITAAAVWSARRRHRRSKQAEEQRIADAVQAALEERDSTAPA